MKLAVNVFPGPQNLGLYVAIARGLLPEVELSFTANSQAQREGIANGTYQIAQAAVDNAVALVDTRQADVVVVAGGGNGLNDFIVRPEIDSIAALGGKTLVVDATHTAYAFLAYKLLAEHGLATGSYAVLPAGGGLERLQAMRADPRHAAAMLNPPASLMALGAGYRSFGPGARVVGAYQADGVWVLRSWAAANGATLVRYLHATIAGLRHAREHRAEAATILAQRLKLDASLATACVDAVLGPGGLAQDARFDWAGFRNALALRAEIQGTSTVAAPERYVDLSYYEKALA